jgi:phage gpG-like protein
MTSLEFSQALRKLATVPSRISADVAKNIRKDIMQRFAKGEDPYRKKWRPLAPATLAKGRRPPPLTASGKGKRGIKVRPSAGAGVALESNVAYMGVHQNGRGNHPPRRSFFPVNVLPKSWAEIVRKAYVKQVRKTLGAE